MSVTNDRFGSGNGRLQLLATLSGLETPVSKPETMSNLAPVMAGFGSETEVLVPKTIMSSKS